jgi:hypothetical protein
MNALYEEYSRLLSLPDSMDPTSDTARLLAEVDAKLKQHEKAEVELWRADMEASLPGPIADAVALNDALSEWNDSGPTSLHRTRAETKECGCMADEYACQMRADPDRDIHICLCLCHAGGPEEITKDVIVRWE